MAHDSFTHTSSLETHSESWSMLTRHGDGYLTPYQREAFEHAITLVKNRLDKTLNKKSAFDEPEAEFNLADYIDKLEDRFLDETSHLGDMEQEVALTAARFAETVAQIILKYQPAGLK
ncbi:hypothetical protein [Marinomonas balearica]|nr:hypothetical protein [Marinomonas balearica]